MVELLQVFGFFAFAIALAEKGALPRPRFRSVIVAGALGVGGGVGRPGFLRMHGRGGRSCFE